MLKVCVVIPAANEERTIGKIIDGVKRHLEQVIVVDDGSSDRTAKIAEDHGVTVIRHPRNLGKGEALKTGFSRALAAGCQAVIFLDADGQHDPDEIPKFIQAALRSRAAIILGNRMKDVRCMPLIRRLTNQFTSFLLSVICRQQLPDSQCGFRLLKKSVLEKIQLSTACFETESEMLIRASRAGFKIDSVPIRTIYSQQISKINPLIDTGRFIRLVVRELFSS